MENNSVILILVKLVSTKTMILQESSSRISAIQGTEFLGHVLKIFIIFKFKANMMAAHLKV